MDELTSLLLDARDGDRRAFDAVIRIAEDPVRRFVSSLVDREEIDDTVQDTFIRSWRSLPHYRVEASGRTWLLAIARHACADVVRRRRRHRRLVDAYGTVQGRETDPGPEEPHALFDLIRALEPDRSEAFTLTQILGLPYVEAAQVCGVPVGTIRSRVARARADLVAGHRKADTG